MRGREFDLPIKVKNTFIECGDEDGDGDADGIDTVLQENAIRQQSAPAPSLLRQISETTALSKEKRQPLPRSSIDSVVKEEEPQEEIDGEAGSSGDKGVLDDTLGPLIETGDFEWSRFQTGEVELASLAMGQQNYLDDQKCQAEPQVGSIISQVGNVTTPFEWSTIFTVMVRNIPNKYTQQMLLQEINDKGFLGTYDFIYLPIDPETNANKGYAFINFVDPCYAWVFKTTFEGCKMSCFNSNKHVSVAPATLQGFDANFAHYSGTHVNRGDPSTRPLFLREASWQALNSSKMGVPRRRRHGGKASLIDVAGQGNMMQSMASNQATPPLAPTQFQGPRQQQQMESGMPINMPKKSSTRSRPAQPAGHDLLGTQKSQTANAPQIRFCPFCGGNAHPSFKFCQFCGASLQDL